MLAVAEESTQLSHGVLGVLRGASAAVHTIGHGLADSWFECPGRRLHSTGCSTCISKEIDYERDEEACREACQENYRETCQEGCREAQREEALRVQRGVVEQVLGDPGQRRGVHDAGAPIKIISESDFLAMTRSGIPGLIVTAV